MKDVKGVIVPVLSLEREDMIRLLDHLSEVDYVFVLGTTGEFDKLTDEKKEEIVKIATEYSKKPVLVGCSDKNADKVIENMHKFSNISVISPNPHEDVEEFYNKIIENTDNKIILYNNPNNPAIGQSISLEVIQKLSKNDRVIGIKDSSGNMELFKEILKLKNENFKVFQGIEITMLESIELGADGVVPSMGNVYPNLLVELFNKKEKSIQNELISLQEIYTRKETMQEGLKDELKKVMK